MNDKQRANLLKHLATVFVRLELNFDAKLTNLTKQTLPIDCLTSSAQIFLFKVVASNLEFKILNFFETNTNSSVSARYVFVYLEDIVSDSLSDFVQLHLPKKQMTVLQYDFSADFSLCDLTVWSQILNYFVKGDSQYLYSQKLPNNSSDLAEEYLLSLLSHFVIKLSNIVLKFLLYHDQRLLVRNLFYRICNVTYLSSRYLMNLKNNFLLSRAVDFYIYTPKYIYENKYLLYYVDLDNIYAKQIYADRHRELFTLFKFQMVVIILVELQDLFFPKIQKLIYLLGKSVIYIASYLVGTVTRILLNQF
nr:Ycf55 [Erythrocladia irregularis]